MINLLPRKLHFQSDNMSLLRTRLPRGNIAYLEIRMRDEESKLELELILKHERREYVTQPLQITKTSVGFGPKISEN